VQWQEKLGGAGSGASGGRAGLRRGSSRADDGPTTTRSFWRAGVSSSRSSGATTAFRHSCFSTTRNRRLGYRPGAAGSWVRDVRPAPHLAGHHRAAGHQRAPRRWVDSRYSIRQLLRGDSIARAEWSRVMFEMGVLTPTRSARMKIFRRVRAGTSTWIRSPRSKPTRTR